MPREWLTRVAFAALTAFGLLGTPPPADAAFTITFQAGGDNITLPGIGNTIIGSVAMVGEYSIPFFNATNNSPGNPVEGRLNFLASVTRNATVDTDDDGPLTITIFADGFTMPSGSLLLEDQLGLTGSPALPGTVTSFSKANSTSTDPFTISTSSGASASDSAQKPFSANGYTLTKSLTFTLVDDAFLGVTSTTLVTANSAVPAPAAWVLALSGLACCGPLTWLRRRKPAGAA